MPHFPKKKKKRFIHLIYRVIGINQCNKFKKDNNKNIYDSHHFCNTNYIITPYINNSNSQQ